MKPEEARFVILVWTVSTLTASSVEPAEVVARIARALRDQLGEVSISLALRISRRKPPIEAHIARQGRSRFQFSRPIAVRHTAYGQLSVDADTPGGSPADWMLALETVAQQLALYAERLHVAEENQRIASELKKLAELLRTRKVFARAAGIIAAARGVSADLARRWLVSEAASRGRSIDVLADQVILEHVAFRPAPAKGSVAA